MIFSRHILLNRLKLKIFDIISIIVLTRICTNYYYKRSYLLYVIMEDKLWRMHIFIFNYISLWYRITHNYMEQGTGFVYH